MGRVYKRKGRYYVDAAEKSRRIRRSVGKSKQVAEIHLKDLEVQIAKGKHGIAPSPILVEEFLEKYLVPLLR